MTTEPHDKPAPQRPTIGRRQLMFGSVLLGMTAATYALAPKRFHSILPDGAIDKVIPEQVGPYRFISANGLVLPPEDELTQQLYNQIVTRVYVAPGLPPMMLLIAYGGTQNLSLELHRPAECYPPQGYAITEPAEVRLDLAGRRINASMMSAIRADRSEQVLYWTRIGDAFPLTKTDQAVAVARENLKGVLPDGVLVRISMEARDSGPALRSMRDFAGRLTAALPAAGKRILFHAPAAAG